MKKYIALIPGGGANSGIKTLEEATAWAAKLLADRTQSEEVLLTEVIRKVRRIAPTVETFEFHPEQPSADKEPSANYEILPQRKSA